MSRAAVDKLVTRMYKESLKSNGRLPSGKETKAMEDKAKKIAERVEREKKK